MERFKRINKKTKLIIGVIALVILTAFCSVTITLLVIKGSSSTTTKSSGDDNKTTEASNRTDSEKIADISWSGLDELGSTNDNSESSAKKAIYSLVTKEGFEEGTDYDSVTIIETKYQLKYGNNAYTYIELNDKYNSVYELNSYDYINTTQDLVYVGNSMDKYHCSPNTGLMYLQLTDQAAYEQYLENQETANAPADENGEE